MPGRSLPSPRRYAQAVFQIAVAWGQLEQWLEDLADIATAVRNPEFAALLDSPGVRFQDKLHAIKEVLPHLNFLAHNLLALLAQRRVVQLAPAILSEYRRLMDARLGIRQAEVISALPLSDGDQGRIAQRLSELWGQEVRVRARVDPSIVGGLIIRLDDRVIDGSVKGRLEAMKKTLAEATL
ncbi:MAG: F0F1 ATP synthase subunit delta [Chloroflexi bacterium]|nr:F0F1 ATP synthase subunit delta [Chloroflexota bacterium]